MAMATEDLVDTRTLGQDARVLMHPGTVGVVESGDRECLLYRYMPPGYSSAEGWEGGRPGNQLCSGRSTLPDEADDDEQSKGWEEDR